MESIVHLINLLRFFPMAISQCLYLGVWCRKREIAYTIGLGLSAVTVLTWHLQLFLLNKCSEPWLILCNICLTGHGFWAHSPLTCVLEKNHTCITTCMWRLSTVMLDSQKEKKLWLPKTVCVFNSGLGLSVRPPCPSAFVLFAIVEVPSGYEATGNNVGFWGV